MKSTRKTVVAATGAVGTAGAVAVACAACCASIPLIAPLLAWLGLSGLGVAVAGWSLPMTGVVVLTLAALLLWRRRRSTSECRHSSSGCGCVSVCPTRR